MNRAVAIGTADVIGAVVLVFVTFSVLAFADMAPAWRILAVFVAVEGGKRLYGETAV